MLPNGVAFGLCKMMTVTVRKSEQVVVVLGRVQRVVQNTNVSKRGYIYWLVGVTLVRLALVLLRVVHVPDTQQQE